MKQLFFVKKYVVSIFVLCSLSTLPAQKILLKWNPNPDVDVKYYSIYRASVFQDETEIAQIPADQLSYEDYDIVRGELYYYRITATDSARNESDYSDPVEIIADVASSSEHKNNQTPRSFELGQNYPNPFNPTTTFVYAVARQVHITLEIYDVLGRKVRTLVGEIQSPGYYETSWDATDEMGESVATGLYLARFQAGDFQQVRKIVLQK